MSSRIGPNLQVPTLDRHILMTVYTRHNGTCIYVSMSRARRIPMVTMHSTGLQPYSVR